jgi:hypothetical protein
LQGLSRAEVPAAGVSERFAIEEAHEPRPTQDGQVGYAEVKTEVWAFSVTCRNILTGDGEHEVPVSASLNQFAGAVRLLDLDLETGRDDHGQPQKPVWRCDPQYALISEQAEIFCRQANRERLGEAWRLRPTIPLASLEVGTLRGNRLIAGTLERRGRQTELCPRLPVAILVYLCRRGRLEGLNPVEVKRGACGKFGLEPIQSGGFTSVQGAEF